MGEGPDLAQPSLAYSTLLGDLDDAQNAISGAIAIVFVPYESVSATDWNTLRQPSATLENAVKNGEANLQSSLKSYTDGCTTAQDKIVLVGYSMGAWVINKWLVDHRSEWPMIKGVLLYGDPCWINGVNIGLARAWEATGCMPAKSYPGPVAGFKIPVNSYCQPHDPVCGGEYGTLADISIRLAQLADAVACATEDCPHKYYWIDGSSTWDLVQGAKAMVKWVGAPVLK
jgi:Cutinase